MTSNSNPFHRVRAEAPKSASDRQRRGADLVRRPLPMTLHDLDAAAPFFQLDAPLARAINVALAVGAPLLLTGEPGTGKTQVAYYLKWYFGIDATDQPYRLSVTSNTTASDLVYGFDHVAYFRESQRAAQSGASVQKDAFLTHGPLWRARKDAEKDRPAVVLLDEIDKAPRDFPNDVLHELDQFSFRVPELDRDIRWPEGKAKPILVITSNSERRLPEPFLRRCIFHHIAFNEQVVRAAVEARQADYPRLDEATRHAAVEALLRLRQNSRLRKHPSTAELLVWLVALDRAGVGADLIQSVPLGRLPMLEALLKDHDDRDALGRG